ncbi:MAG TPA: hypothetical protein PKH77_22605 [Anaerolineae bacterium]|nr:hypothetical protein [Anaerolineae bacterium]
MRNWLIVLIAGLILVIPPLVGYAGAPCDPLTAKPLVLSPYRLAQQRYLVRADTALTTMADIAVELHVLATQPAPVSSAEAFRRAGRASDLAAQLEQIVRPNPPAVYTLLGERLGQVRDTYSLAAEDLLAYLGNNDLAQLQAAGEALALADAVRAELVAAVAGLHYPLCREVWRDE